MPQVGFELMIPVLERAKTVYALDRAATVIGGPKTIHYKPKESTFHRHRREHFKSKLKKIFGVVYISGTRSTEPLDT
jgi:hypothetical protein